MFSTILQTWLFRRFCIIAVVVARELTSILGQGLWQALFVLERFSLGNPEKLVDPIGQAFYFSFAHAFILIKDWNSDD